MTKPAAVASEKPILHCFAKCRDKRSYTRVPGMSRPVFTCDGCGSSREIEELGRVEIPGRVSPVPPPSRAPAPAPAPVAPKRTYTNRRTPKETTVSKNPLQKMVEAAVSAATEPLLERIKALEEKDAPELDESAVKKLVDERLEELAGDSNGARPTRRRSPDAAAACPRAPHPGRHGQACRDAGYKG